MTKDEQREYMREWRRKNPEYYRFMNRAYRKQNKEKAQAYQKKYYRTHRDEILRRSKERRAKRKQDERESLFEMWKVQELNPT